MPELPEVETVARQLQQRVAGRKLHSVTVRDAKLRGPDWDSVAGYTITQARRVGKRVVLDLDGPKEQPPRWIAVHLRMTGRLLWCADGRRDDLLCTDLEHGGGEAKDKSLRMVFALDGGELRFHDQRRFGTVELLAAEPAISEGALDALSRGFTAKALERLLTDARGEIKPWIMRQDKLPGMGNIYASEALFRARIHPRRDAGSLSSAEVKALRDAISAVLRESIRAEGTTFSDYRDSSDRSGRFRDRLRVYGCAGEDCRDCSGKIEKITQQQRSTFLCPRCQK